MSFFQYEDLSVLAGNTEYKEIISIDKINLTARVKGIKFPVPIHYHCDEDATVDNQKSFDASYPDDDDMKGASAFRVGDMVRVMYRLPNNQYPIIVGWEGEDKKCGPKYLLIVAEQAQSTTERTPFLCILWDPDNNKVPDDLGINFPVPVNDPILEACIGKFPSDPIPEESDIQEPTELYTIETEAKETLLPLSDANYNKPLKLLKDSGGGGGMVTCIETAHDQRIYDAELKYSPYHLEITDNFEEACTYGFLTPNGPYETIWAKYPFERSNPIEGFPPSFYSEGKVDLGVENMKAFKNSVTQPGGGGAEIKIPGLDVPPSALEEIREYWRAVQFRWERDIDPGSGYMIVNKLWTIKMPFNSVAHSTDQIMFRDAYSHELEETDYGKDLGLSPQALGGNILKVNVGEFKGGDAQIRGSGHHYIYQSEYYTRIPESEQAQHEAENEMISSRYLEYAITDREYTIHLPVGIVWDIPVVETVFSFVSKTTISIDPITKDPDGEPFGPLAGEGCTFDSITHFLYKGQLTQRSIFTMMDINEWRIRPNPYYNPAYPCVNREYADVNEPTISSAISHPAWSAGVIEDEGVMFQIYAFFPPLITNTVFRNGLTEDQEQERKEEQERYNSWPMDPGPPVLPDSSDEEVSHPYNFVWAACNYFNGERNAYGESIDWETIDPREQEENEDLTNAIKQFILDIRGHGDYDPEKLIFFKTYGTQFAVGAMPPWDYI